MHEEDLTECHRNKHERDTQKYEEQEAVRETTVSAMSKGVSVPFVRGVCDPGMARDKM